MKMIKLSDYVMKFLVEKGMWHVCFLPGGGCMHLVDSLGSNINLKHTAFLHEQAAAIAADAHAQYTQSTGVVLVTTGPGGTNAITGVAASWIDSTPVLYLSGQAKRQDLMNGRGVRQMGVQEVDIIALVKPITKYAETVLDPNKIRLHLEEALEMANSGRKGPVWLEIPLDVQGAMIDEDALVKRHVVKTKVKSKSLKKDIANVLKLMVQAKRPVILAGNGVRGGERDIESIAETLNTPVLLTWRSADFMEDSNPWYFGRPGAVGQRAANFIQQNADLLIIIGARLDLPQTAFNHANFAPNAHKVIIDIDSNEINKMAFKKTAIVADAKKFVSMLADSARYKLLAFKRKYDWLHWCDKMKKKYPVPDKSSLTIRKGCVNTYLFVEELSKMLTCEHVLVPGSSGSCAEITMQTIKIAHGLRLLNTPGLGSMGFGLPAAIGACIASHRKTITIVGDGGLQHNIQELETLNRLQLPVKLFVLNNNGYGSIRMMQNRHFNGRLVACNKDSGLTLPSLSKIAAAYGIKYISINKNRRLSSKIKKALNSYAPVICEVFVDPDLETAPRVSSAVLPDGKIVSKPMEDLYPFLDRDEFNANMILDDIIKKHKGRSK